MLSEFSSYPIWQEYGITRDEKLLISQCICTPLLRKILADFQHNTEEEDSTRLDSRSLTHFLFFIYSNKKPTN